MTKSIEERHAGKIHADIIGCLDIHADEEESRDELVKRIQDVFKAWIPPLLQDQRQEIVETLEKELYARFGCRYCNARGEIQSTGGNFTCGNCGGDGHDFSDYEERHIEFIVQGFINTLNK